MHLRAMWRLMTTDQKRRDRYGLRDYLSETAESWNKNRTLVLYMVKATPL